MIEYKSAPLYYVYRSRCEESCHDVEGTYCDGERTYVYTECKDAIDKTDDEAGTVKVHHSDNIASTSEALFSAVEESNFWNRYLI